MRECVDSPPRSSHRMCSVKKVVLKNFAIFTGKHLFWGLYKVEKS